MTAEEPESGWEFVAETDGTASLLGALVDLDPGEAYTKSDLADAAGVPLKTLYLVDTFQELETIGVLDRVDSADGEARFSVVADSPVLEAARAFDAAVAEQR